MQRRSEIPAEFLEPPRSNGLPETFTATDLMAAELPPVKWIVPDILPEGVTILAGKPKLGKSWMAFGLGVAVASGGVALGTKPVEQGEALYLALEDNPRRLQRRLKKMLAGDTPPEGLHLCTAWPGMDEGGSEALDKRLTEHPNTRLVVVDILKKVRARTSGNRNAYDADYEALETLHPLAAEHGVAVLVVHHLRKMQADDPLDEISGSTGLSGGADGFLVLKRDRGGGDAYLHVDGRDIEEPAELALTWSGDTASWTLAGDAEQFRRSAERQEILDLLADADGPMGPKDVASAIGKGGSKGYNAVRQLLYQMSRDGEVKTVGHGKYTIANNANGDNKPHNNEDSNATVVSGPNEAPNKEAGEGEPNVRDVSDVRDTDQEEF